MTRSTIRFAAAVVALIGPDAALAQATPKRAVATLDSIRARIAAIVDSTGIPSLAVAVSKGGKIVLEAGFGFADIDRKVPATPNTLYSIASVSKPYTATAVMKLVEQGRIDLDRPANDYLTTGQLTGLAGPASGATVRRVLSHTAGLPLHARFFYEGAPESRPTMKQSIDRYGILVFPPGEVYNYANLGYGILEQIVADVSGRSFEDFMQAEIFAPLGLKETAIGTGAGIANAAVRYNGQKRPIAPYDFDHRGASAVWASAHDLARFGMFHLRNRLKDQKPALTDSTIVLMQRPATPPDSPGRYGLGWSLSEEQGLRVVQHSGGMPGVVAYLLLFPDQDVAVATMANIDDTGVPLRVARMLAGAVIPTFDVAVAQRPRTRSAPSAFALPDSLVGEWDGTVRTYDDQKIPFKLLLKSDDVHAQLVTGRVPLWTVLNQPSFSRGILGGALAVTVPTEEALRYPQIGYLTLLHRGDTLRGYLVSAWVLDRPTAGLPSYVEVTRKRPRTGNP
ncbi:MAG: serine hydrolase domain-containing protein [Gemmatimonadales bacterium]|nr:serine hydrolase domain-containing protein [Gemmatimonadales bacterium]